MDERLKRRLIGVCALLLLALLISFLLPSPGTPPSNADGLKHVTLDLSQPAGTVAAAPVQTHTPLPPVIAAPSSDAADATAAEEDSAPQFDQPAGHDSVPDSADVPAQSPHAQATPKPDAKPEAKPPAAAIKPAPPVASTVTKPEPIKPEPTKPKPAPPAAADAAAHSPAQQGHWYVQVGVFSDIDNARHLAGQLKSGGYPTVISPAETHAGVAYRVKAGPYANQAQAEAAQNGMPKVGIAQSIILKP